MASEQRTEPRSGGNRENRRAFWSRIPISGRLSGGKAATGAACYSGRVMASEQRTEPRSGGNRENRRAFWSRIPISGRLSGGKAATGAACYSGRV